MPDVSTLTVRLHDEPVGTLTRVGGDRTLFAFNDAYMADAERPVLSLGFKDRFGELITDFKPVRTRLMPFFSGLLPEGQMRTYLARWAGVNPTREFFLLWALGRDLPGAITVEAADGGAWPAEAETGGENRGRGEEEKALRFSLAGVQLKFSAVLGAAGGLTIPARGVGGDWIVKLPAREYDGVPENEYAMMTLARLVGIDVPAVRLLALGAIGNLPEEMGRLSGQAFAIKRFDRLGAGKAVHIEDFAQVFGVYPEAKYDKASYRNVAAVLGVEGGDNDVAEFVRRLVFNTLIGNADMHLKNWSVIYPDQRRAALAPAYDLLSTVPYLPDEEAALKVSRTKRFDEFTEDELTHLAAKARLPEKLVLTTARETVARFREHWAAERANLPLARKVIDAVEAQLEKVPIAQ